MIDESLVCPKHGVMTGRIGAFIGYCQECHEEARVADMEELARRDDLVLVDRLPGYKARCEIQVKSWVAGISRHNKIDDECCPDFSCCTPKSLQPREVRELFAASDGEQREHMLFGFLGGMLKDVEPNTYLAGQKIEDKEHEDDGNG